MKEPDSMDELLFFTNRRVGDGTIRAWTYRPDCPKCKARMGKPINPKTKKVDKKSLDYECPKCAYRVLAADADKDLKVEVIYTCPFCKKSGETETEYNRKKWQGVLAYVFLCKSCGKEIGITKKLKAAKEK